MRSLSPLYLDSKTVLFEASQVIDTVYFPLTGMVSLVTPLTLSKDPIAWDMAPVALLAVQSVEFPTVSGRCPAAGRNGRGRGAAHGTSFHSVLG